MIRVVLAVVLTVALLAAVTPAIEESRTARTAMHLDRVTERVERAAHSLHTHEDATRPSVPGARRFVRFRLPERSWTAVDARLWVDGEDDLVGYRLAGERPHRTTVPAVDLRTPDGRVVFGASGRYRLRLSLVRTEGVGVVVARA